MLPTCCGRRGSIAIDADPDTIGSSTLSDELWGGASMLANSPADFWAYAQGARYNTFAFRGCPDGRLRQRQQQRHRLV